MMNIIFGRQNAATLSEKYTVLELDTIRISNSGPELTAFCVIESVPILNMPKLDKMKELHANLLIEYRKQNWNYCEQAMEHLRGFWSSELDTFYDNLTERINFYKDNEPAEDWDGIIVKHQS